MDIIEELDSLEHYKLIGDETELKWFYDNCVPKPLQSEAFAFCLSSRHKKLTEEERKGTGLGRSEMLDPNVSFPDAEGKMSYHRWKKAILKYECNKFAFTTKEGKPFPAKTLVCYYYINPTDELGVVSDIKKYIATHEQELVDSAMKTDLRAKTLNNIVVDMMASMTEDGFNAESMKAMIDASKERIQVLAMKADDSGVRQSLYKLCKSLTKFKRLQFDNCGTKYWVDFDMDVRDKSQKGTLYNNWNKYCCEKLGKGNFVIVETGGGFHTLVKKQVIHFNPNQFIMDFCHKSSGNKCDGSVVIDGTQIDDSLGKSNAFVTEIEGVKYYTNGCFIDELVYNTNAMIPCPGTYQYGNVVRIRNKEDYIIESDMKKEE